MGASPPPISRSSEEKTSSEELLRAADTSIAKIRKELERLQHATELYRQRKGR